MTPGFTPLLALLVIIAAVAIGILINGQSYSNTQQDRTPDRATRANAGGTPPFDSTHSKPTKTRPRVVGKAYVVDGDTIKIGQLQIRLFGIDAPELDHPYGKKSKWALHRLCKGQQIRAEITDTDNHGRTVARCFLNDGRDLSEEMVSLGLAIDWPKFSGGRYAKFEVHDARKRMFLADARQKGRMDIWVRFEKRQQAMRAQKSGN